MLNFMDLARSGDQVIGVPFGNETAGNLPFLC